MPQPTSTQRCCSATETFVFEDIFLVQYCQNLKKKEKLPLWKHEV